MSKRKQHHPEFKAKVAIEALKGEETVSKVARPKRTRIFDADGPKNTPCPCNNTRQAQNALSGPFVGMPGAGRKKN